MKLKWKIFRLLNYIVGFFYVLKLTSVISFATSKGFGSRDILFYIPFLLTNVYIIINCCFNLYIIHGNFPENKMDSRRKRMLLVTLIFFPLCMVLENYFFWNGVSGIDTEEYYRAYITLLTVWISITILELAILAGQFVIWKMQKAKAQDQYESMIEEIGRD